MTKNVTLLENRDIREINSICDSNARESHETQFHLFNSSYYYHLYYFNVKNTKRMCTFQIK